MKLPREELKLLIKECIIEVLEEGLSSSESAITEGRVLSKKQPVRSKDSPKPLPRRGEHVSFAPRKPQRPTPRTMLPNINPADPLASLLEDTAATTLQYQNDRTDAKGNPLRPAYADPKQELVASVDDPSELFGESAGRWAQVAFMNAKSDKQ